MKSAAKFKALIFDFNGVLLWDDRLQRDSWRAYASQLRPEALSDHEIDIHVHGRNGQYTLEYLLNKPINPAEAIELMEQKETIYRKMCLALDGDFKLSPGAIGLLDFLVLNKIPHTIATASAMPNLDFFVQQLNLERWFEIEKIVYDNGKIPGKPAPDLYLEAARKLNILPGACVVVEDSLSGIQAAHRAGAGWVVALGPVETHPTLINLPGVNQVISNLGQIVDLNLFKLTGEHDRS
jgi:beta-phosphoglucomutase-like phosphatase (HAD superfamily)